MTATIPLPTLTESECRSFREQGFIGPFTAFSRAEMAEIDAHLVENVFRTAGPSAPKHTGPVGPDRFFMAGQSRHLDDEGVYRMCTHPEVVGRMASLYGPDLLLWRSNFFLKEPGGLEIPWHQDLNYWPLEPLVNITAWMACDDIDGENACVNLIPGSHKKTLPHVPKQEGERIQFHEKADPEAFEVKDAVAMHLAPGQFFLFNEKTLHQSDENRSDRRRLGLAIRVTVPFVDVDHDRLFPDHACQVLCGEDRMGINRVVGPTTGRVRAG